MKTSEIYNLCQNYYDVDLDTESRKRIYVYPRMVFYKLCQELASDFTLSLCGVYVSKNHSSIHHALDMWQMFKDQSFFSDYMDDYRSLRSMCANATCVTIPMRVEQMSVTYQQVS